MGKLYLAAALAAVAAATAVFDSAHATPQTPIDRAAAALVASEKCGGTLTKPLSDALAVAIEQEGSGAVEAAEYRYRALWTEAGVDTDSIRRDAMCAQIYRNGWLL